ncbi:hypothetical protein DPX16_15159 [Anabarilius grahami]|uniref:Uncharacterized protein n=1 Tax=Anabarilius grahami TaxID=495550 RepID=A0A3N0YWI5_ANAGA|nr:hypothetical protein DPX16_15159 [Anabarilius grahami]
MDVLQLIQAKLQKLMNPETFKELRSTTDSSMGSFSSMGSLVLNRHLWLTLTEMRDSEKTAILDAPVHVGELFSDAVGTFLERLLEAQKHLKPRVTSCPTLSWTPFCFRIKQRAQTRSEVETSLANLLQVPIAYTLTQNKQFLASEQRTAVCKASTSSPQGS